MTGRTARARAAIAAFAVFLPLDLVTMNPSIGFMDRGELAAVASTWGIPHATGYPLLMLLAGALVHLVPLRAVLVLNAFAATLVALGSAMLVLLFDRVLAAADPAREPRARAALAFLGATVTSVSVTWWQQANGFEVYALHCLLLPLVLVLALRWLDADASGAPVARRDGFVFALVTGLSFTNHMTTVLLAPGLVLLAVWRLGGRRLAHRLPLLGAAFLLGLLPYAWLPIRSAMHPAFDWGAPHTWRAFLHHVSGADYRPLMFGGGAPLRDQLRFIGWQLPWDFAWVGLPLAALGIACLWRRARPLACCLLLTAIAGVAVPANYGIADLDAYLLTAVVACGAALTAGLLLLHDRCGRTAAVTTGAVLAVAGLGLHWQASDEHGNGIPEAFVRDLVEPLPPDAVLFAGAWSHALSPAWYFQAVEHVRTDVTIVDPDLVRVRWYVETLERRAPELVRRAEPEFRAYHDLLCRAESDRPYDGREVDAARRRFLTALATGALADRPVFTTSDQPEVPGCGRVPYHLALRLTRDTAYVAEPAWACRYRAWGTHHLDAAIAAHDYAEARIARAAYERAHGHHDAVLPLVAAAAAFDPHVGSGRLAPLPCGADRALATVDRYFRDLHDAEHQLAARAAPRNGGTATTGTTVARTAAPRVTGVGRR